MSSQSEIIGEEWKARAVDLADWALERFLNRRDVWGQYTVLTPDEQRRFGKPYKALTLPQRSMRGSDMVTHEKLARHFSSIRNRKPQIIGLHAKSEKGTSKWLAIDIDLHEVDKNAAAEDQARRNLLAALHWWKQLQKMGYDPLLLDSNGAGGFHLLVFFREAAPTSDVYVMGKKLVSDWEENSLSEEPETFPKGSGEKESLGAWLRLPGMHHSRDHYTRVWSGDDWLDDPWLSGHAAIDVLLDNAAGSAPPEAGRDALEDAKQNKRKKAPGAGGSSSFSRTKKPVVCVDLDGVLARYGGFAGKFAIGDPIDGAVEFTRELSERATVVIVTARLGAIDGLSEKRLRERESLAGAIESWLHEHGFSFDHLHKGGAKPRAVAYIDDRAVPCRPQQLGNQAFAAALRDVDELSGAS